MIDVIDVKFFESSPFSLSFILDKIFTNFEDSFTIYIGMRILTRQRNRESCQSKVDRKGGIDEDSWYRNDRTLESFEGRFVADEIEPLDGVKYYPPFHHPRKDCMGMSFTRQYCFLLCVNFFRKLRNFKIILEIHKEK